MAPSNSSFASAPTYVMQPNHTDQYFASSHYIDQNGHTVAPNGASLNGASLNGASPSGSVNIGTLALGTPLAETPGSLAGRKRSRGGIDAPEDENDMSGDTANHDSGPSVPVWSKVESRPFELQHIKRPSITSRKSQRVDSDATSQDHLAQLVLPAEMREATAEPLVSEVTRLLGVSWTPMDSSESRQINQAAYTKWIQKYYTGLQDIAVLFQYANEECPAYLVQATNTYSGQVEFYLFSDDLTEARLVTRESQQLVPRLQMMPALHLAAPGGCIRAESDLITANQNTMNAMQAGMTQSATDAQMQVENMRGEAISSEMLEPVGTRSAHALDMDWM